MTIAIYCIEHILTSRKYVGKSKNAERRLCTHKSSLRSKKFHKNTNAYLWAAVQKYGWSEFKFYFLETFSELDDDVLAERELHWMDVFESYSSGFNLRRDSSTGMVVHESTRLKQSLIHSGVGNANCGNFWSDEMRENMSEIAKNRHASGIYGDAWRKKQSENSKRTWRDHQKRKSMALNVSTAKTRYAIVQYDRDGRLVKVWNSVKELVTTNPNFKWQCIYAVCSGEKATYKNFIWQKAPLEYVDLI